MMNINWQQIVTKWESLALREKTALTVGSVFLVLVVLYLGLWQPSLNAIEHLRQQIRTDQKTLAWMQIIDSKIKTLQKQTHVKPREITAVMLLTELQKQIRIAQLNNSLTQLKQASSNTIELHFEHVNFDKLINMLTYLNRHYYISISQFSVTAQEEKGLVNADIMIETTKRPEAHD